MGKFIVITGFTLFACGMLAHCAPATNAPAFFLGTFPVRWILLCFVGFLWGGYKMAD